MRLLEICPPCVEKLIAQTLEENLELSSRDKAHSIMEELRRSRYVLKRIAHGDDNGE